MHTECYALNLRFGKLVNSNSEKYIFKSLNFRLRQAPFPSCAGVLEIA